MVEESRTKSVDWINYFGSDPDFSDYYPINYNQYNLKKLKEKCKNFDLIKSFEKGDKSLIAFALAKRSEEALSRPRVFLVCDYFFPGYGGESNVLLAFTSLEKPLTITKIGMIPHCYTSRNILKYVEKGIKSFPFFTGSDLYLYKDAYIFNAENFDFEVLFSSRSSHFDFTVKNAIVHEYTPDTLTEAMRDRLRRNLELQRIQFDTKENYDLFKRTVYADNFENQNIVFQSLLYCFSALGERVFDGIDRIGYFD